MQVQQILHAKGNTVTCVSPETPITEVLQVLARHGVGALVVSGDGLTIAGIVSERDVVRGLAVSGPALLDHPVGDIMTVEVQTCGPGDTVEELMARMTNGRFRHLPVVDGGQLTGIVSIGDIVKLRLHELESEARQLLDYIRGG
jgi:CBS domain-containing protein